ncbi:MAG: hypothetical protein ACKPEQ_40630 [Dolichospermum sp.]
MLFLFLFYHLIIKTVNTRSAIALTLQDWRSDWSNDGRKEKPQGYWDD